jgi:fatty acid desaturase
MTEETKVKQYHKPVPSVSALVALFAAAVAAGYTSAQLWQMTLALALLTVIAAWLGNR